MPHRSLRSQIASIGGHAVHAKYDSAVLTAPGRAAAAQKLNDRLIAEYGLDLAELGQEAFDRRLAHARSAHFKRISLLARGARRTGAKR